jgi:hypothetical protein
MIRFNETENLMAPPFAGKSGFLSIFALRDEGNEFESRRFGASSYCLFRNVILSSVAPSTSTPMRIQPRGKPLPFRTVFLQEAHKDCAQRSVKVPISFNFHCFPATRHPEISCVFFTCSPVYKVV